MKEGCTPNKAIRRPAPKGSAKPMAGKAPVAKPKKMNYRPQGR